MRRRLLLGFASIEAAFYGWCKWKINEYEKNVVPFNETTSSQIFDRERRRVLVEKLLEREYADGAQRGNKWLSGWFFHEKQLHEINRFEIKTFLAWAYFNKQADQLSCDEIKEIHEDILRIERLGKFRFKNGHDISTRILRPNMDTLHNRILHKPLIIYFLSEVVLQRVLVPFAMRRIGFRKKEVVHEDKTLKYWYRYDSHQNSSEKKQEDTKPKSSSSSPPPPIVFLHGVGIGVLAYVQFFAEILKSNNDRTLLVPEFTSVSMTIPVDIGMTPVEASALLMKMLRESSIECANFVSHSYGSFVLAWFLRHHSKKDLKIEKAVFIDPVNIGVHRSILARNFLYQTSKLDFFNSKSYESSLLKFALTQILNRDARVVSNFMRNLRWYESFVLEEFENNQNCKKFCFFFSEKDNYLDAAMDFQDVRNWSKSNDLNEYVTATFWPGLTHGEFLLCEDRRREIIYSL